MGNKTHFGNLMVDLGIALDFLTAMGYLVDHDGRRVFYWLSATLLMIAIRLGGV